MCSFTVTIKCSNMGSKAEHFCLVCTTVPDAVELHVLRRRTSSADHPREGGRCSALPVQPAECPEVMHYFLVKCSLGTVFAVLAY